MRRSVSRKILDPLAVLDHRVAVALPAGFRLLHVGLLFDGEANTPIPYLSYLHDPEQKMLETCTLWFVSVEESVDDAAQLDTVRHVNTLTFTQMLKIDEEDRAPELRLSDSVDVDEDAEVQVVLHEYHVFEARAGIPVQYFTKQTLQ